jgi:hypothetical protein
MTCTRRALWIAIVIVTGKRLERQERLDRLEGKPL